MANVVIEESRPGGGSKPLRFGSQVPATSVIELIGVPGAGKTTVARILEDVLRDEGLTPYDVVSAARIYARRTWVGRTFASLLAGSLLSKALWGVYLVYSWVYALIFAFRYPRLVRQVVTSQRRRPDEADVAERKVLFWYARLIGSYGFLLARARSGEVLILDEGFVHRVVQLQTSEVETPSAAAIEQYLRLIPKPTAVIHVTAPRELCLDRIRARGVWPRYQEDDSSRLQRFVESADRAVEGAVETMDRSGWSVSQVDNSGDVSSIRPTLVHLVRGSLFGSDADPLSPGRGPLYTTYLPRPGYVRELVEASVRPPVVSRVAAEQVLAQFGHSVGAISNLPMGWRNRNVLVETDHGARVLRQYPERWTFDAIQFEHSVLGRLADVEFPAPRLVSNVEGETLITHGGSNWALYEKVDGSNLGACFIRPSERVSLTYLAGQLLARFHRDMSGFTPTGQHHLGFDGEDAERHLDLSGYLKIIAEMAEDPEELDGVAMLKCRASELAERLTRLGEAVSRPPVSKTVIHGDYGFHNLLFRRTGTATVLDFELARIDLKLIDLVRMLSRQKRYAGRSFAAGYRSSSRISLDEWRLLPEVWEFYRLSGAVRSWRLGKEMGDPRRLATAQNRINEADWISENRLAPWGNDGLE